MKIYFWFELESRNKSKNYNFIAFVPGTIPLEFRANYDCVMEISGIPKLPK
jgi:hypothetical protein